MFYQVVFDDISCAMKLWSSIMVENVLCEDHPLASEIDKALPLLYHIADLLSMKVHWGKVTLCVQHVAHSSVCPKYVGTWILRHYIPEAICVWLIGLLNVTNDGRRQMIMRFS